MRSAGVLAVVVVLVGTLGVAVPAARAVEDEAKRLSWWTQPRLTGDWGGARTTLEEHGLAIEAVYTGDTWGVVHGGLERGVVYLANTDLSLTIDADRAVGWHGGSFFIYGLGNHGGSPSEMVGDAMVLDNIDAPSTWKLYEAWFQQTLVDERLSVLAGLYNVNGEFDTLDSASLFIQSAAGINVAMSQTGQNGPSIFPVTSLATRVKVQATDRLYAQAALLDGVPGNPNDPYGTQIMWSTKEGYLLTGEVGYVVGRVEDDPIWYGKYAIGGWGYTAKFDDVHDTRPDGSPERGRGNTGFYMLAEQTVLREDDDAQGLIVFVRAAAADARYNQFGTFLGAGAVYTGPIPGRDADQVGFAFATVSDGEQFEDALRDTGRRYDTRESVLELTYNLQLTGWLRLQPDVQYIINPGAGVPIPDAVVVGGRFAVTF